MCLLAKCISSMEKCLLRFSDHFSIELFVFLLLSCMNSLYIFEIKPYQLHHLQIFSPILQVVFSFFFFMISFAVQKLVKCDQVSFVQFCFQFALETDLRKHWYNFVSENVLPMIPSRSFVVSNLMFKSLSHFKFIFVYDESSLIYMWLSNFLNTTW